MKNFSLMALTLCSTTLLSADYYGYNQSSCPNGNCPYQGQSRNYNQEASGQQYYRSHPEQYDRNYNQNYSRDNQYDRNQPYNRNDGYNQQYDQRNNYRNDGYNQRYDSRNDSPNNQGGYYNTNHSNSNGYVSDDELRKKISKSLDSGWLSSGYPNVNYDVNNGVVYLRGSVKNQDERNDVEKAIRKIDGVKEVNNQINISNAENTHRNEYRDNNYNESPSNNNYQDSVKKSEAAYPQDSASSESDRIINSKIRDKLSGWFTKGYETITLNTSNGNVTITGYVEKPDDVEKINKEIRSVDGVKNVNNNANVQKR